MSLKRKRDANPKCRLRRWLQTSGFADLFEWFCLLHLWMSSKANLLKHGKRLFLKIKWPCFFLGFCKIKNFTDGLRDSLPELKTKQTFHPSTIKRTIKVDFANFSTANISHINPPVFSTKKTIWKLSCTGKVHQVSTKFPYLTKMPKKKLWLSVDPSQVVAVPFSPRPIPSSSVPCGKGELLTGAPKTPKLQDQTPANETKCVRLHYFRFSKIIRIFWLAEKKYWCCKNGNSFFHLQWIESLPNLWPI